MGNQSKLRRTLII